MPNWCQCILEVSGFETKEEARKFIEKAENLTAIEESPSGYKDFVKYTQFSLREFLPYPNGEWNYDWCCEKWGVKWDTDCYEDKQVEIEEDDNGYSLEYRFDSPWASPQTAIESISAMYPKYTFVLTGMETGMSFVEVGIYEKEYNECDSFELQWKEEWDWDTNPPTVEEVVMYSILN